MPSAISSTAMSALAGAALSLCLVDGVAAQQIPEGYPADYANVISAASAEGTLRVYGSLDEPSAEPLLTAFKALYPNISLEYLNLNTSELYNRVISEAAAGQPGADLVFTSAVDSAVRMITEGYAAEYASPETPNLPEWAVWQNQLYGVTADPMQFLYNKRLLSEDLVPKSHADLLRLVKEQPDVFGGKVIALDPTRTSGILLNIYDEVHMPNFWELIQVLSAADMKLQTGQATMIEKVVSGEAALAWNIEGGYVAFAVAKNDNLGAVTPSDYTLMRSRSSFIMKSGEHPNAAKLFLDLLLSKNVQEALSEKSKMYSVRTDAASEFSGNALVKTFGDALRPIPLNEDVLERLSQDKRVAFIQKFQETARGN